MACSPHLTFASSKFYPFLGALISLSSASACKDEAVKQGSLTKSQDRVRRLPSMAGEAKKLFAASEVALHASRKDCWVIIGGKASEKEIFLAVLLLAL